MEAGDLGGESVDAAGGHPVAHTLKTGLHRSTGSTVLLSREHNNEVARLTATHRHRLCHRRAQRQQLRFLIFELLLT